MWRGRRWWWSAIDEVADLGPDLGAAAEEYAWEVEGNDLSSWVAVERRAQNYCGDCDC